MTDNELYDLIMSDEQLKKYLEEDNYKRLYRRMKETYSGLSFGELTAFLKGADIDITKGGVVPVEAYKGDKNITSYDFSNIKTIETSAFADSGIKKVVLRNSQTVGPMAFMNSDVGELYASDGVTLGAGSFSRCNNLVELYLTAGVILDKLVFASCRHLNEVVFDDGRTNWPEDLFVGVKKVDYVTMPDTITAGAMYKMFDSNIEIDTLFINCSRNDIDLDQFKIFPNIHNIEFLK